METVVADTSPRTSKSLPTLVQELWDLITSYVRQETVEPLQGLKRLLGWGIVGAVLTGLGLALLLVGALRALQTETDLHFTGSLSWLPYAIVLVVSVLLMAFIASRPGRVK